jgi:hypothetical protein
MEGASEGRKKREMGQKWRWKGTGGRERKNWEERIVREPKGKDY